MAPALSDKILCILSNYVYEFSEEPSAEMGDKSLDSFEVFDQVLDEELGLAAKLLITKDKGLITNEGVAVFAFVGTSSSTAGAKFYASQMGADYELSQDPDQDQDITKAANKWVKESIAKLERQHTATKWSFCSTGHSLGASLASASAIAADPKIERCVTFESPGNTKFWRDRAAQAHDKAYWAERIVEYVTFPNPINTALPHVGKVVRLVLDIHSTLAPTHVARCLLGSAFRLAVWYSVVNLLGSAVPLPLIGRTKGFWAAKVWSGTRKFGRKLLTHRGNAVKAFREARRDARRQAEQEGASGAAEDRLKLLPFVPSLPPRVKSALVTSLWAAGTIAGSSLSYVMTRSSGNMADCKLDHETTNLIMGFDEEGKPKRAVAMESWPNHKQLIDGAFTSKHSRRVVSEGLLPFQPAAYGVHNLLRRFEILMHRASSLPGYKEAKDQPEPQAAD